MPQFETVEEALARGVTVTVCPGFKSGPNKRTGKIIRLKEVRNSNGNARTYTGVISSPSGQIGFAQAEFIDEKPEIGSRVDFYIGAVKNRPAAIGVRLAMVEVDAAD